jgi:hypothetical protein
MLNVESILIDVAAVVEVNAETKIWRALVTKLVSLVYSGYIY